jgi:hypothetical protein
MKTMKTSDDVVPVKQFIAESEQNLDIATAIYEQYEEAREAIVKAFLARLETDLSANLKGWSFSYDPPFFTSAYGSFSLNKLSWENRYAILLEAYDWGERMIYGVWRNEALIGSVPRSAELVGAVRKKLPDATSRKYYEAEIRLTSPAKDWRKPGVLWRMHSDATFRQEVKALLLEVVELGEKRIDALVKNPLKAKA